MRSASRVVAAAQRMLRWEVLRPGVQAGEVLRGLVPRRAPLRCHRSGAGSREGHGVSGANAGIAAAALSSGTGHLVLLEERCRGEADATAVSSGASPAPVPSEAAAQKPASKRAPGAINVDQENLRSRRIFLTGEINDDSAKVVVQQLLFLEAEDPC